MAFLRNKWALAALVILCWAIASSSALGYYYLKFQELSNLLKEYEKYVIHVNICINSTEYDGKILWHNNTLVPLGYSLLQATELVASVNATPYGWGYLVDAINGIWSNETHYWLWYCWDGQTNSWKFGEVGADQHILQDGETVKWQYEESPW